MFGLSGLISGVVDIFGGWIKRKQKIANAKAERKATLIQSKTDNDHAWEMAEINKGDMWLRRACFAMFSLPFIVAMFDPTAVNDYFTVGLSSVPAWYQHAFMAMVGAIWGVVELKNAVTMMRRPKQTDE